MLVPAKINAWTSFSSRDLFFSALMNVVDLSHVLVGCIDGIYDSAAPPPSGDVSIPGSVPEWGCSAPDDLTAAVLLCLVKGFVPL